MSSNPLCSSGESIANLSFGAQITAPPLPASSHPSGSTRILPRTTTARRTRSPSLGARRSLATVRFVADSPLEESGYELLVPLA
jgi:hypothetical protein